jgi:hypothetical protein
MRCSTFLVTFFSLLPGTLQYSSRLECLENTGANLLDDEHWTRGEIDPHRHSKSNNPDDFQWTYFDSNCPLADFDLEDFCINSVGCGNSMLLVGDSTIEYLVLFFLRYYPHSIRHTSCPIHFQKFSKTLLNYNPSAISANRQVTKPIVPVNHIKICQEECGSRGEPVSLTYMMHDYLDGIHGDVHRQVCDEWINIAHQYNVLFLSFGAHTASMATHPFGTPAPDNFNITAFLEKTSAELVRKINEQVLSKNPALTILYLSAGTGHRNFTQDCFQKPDQLNANNTDDELDERGYHWSLVREAQRIYMHALRTKTKVATNNTVITLDLQHIQAEQRECMRDYMHYTYDTLMSPYFLQWQFIHNVLSAYNANKYNASDS